MLVSSEARVIGSLNIGLCMSILVAFLVLPAQCSTCNDVPTPQGDVALLQAASQTNRVTMSQFFAEDILSSKRGLIIPSAWMKLEGNMKVIMFVLCLTVGVIIVMCCVFCLIRSRSGIGEEDEDGLEANSGSLAHFGSKQEAVSEDDQVKFCPELVVPSDCECALLLPNTVVMEKTCDILDPNGDIVLQVIPKSEDPWQVDLVTSKGKLLARCGVAPEGGAEGEYHFFQAAGGLFAKLAIAEDNGSITFVNGSRLQLSCLSEQLVDLADEKGHLLASLEHAVGGTARSDEHGGHFRLRVAPLVDAGVALCGVLCISHWRKFGKK